jgi:hypothetical protein
MTYKGQSCTSAGIAGTAKHLEVTKMSKDIVPKFHAVTLESLTCSEDLSLLLNGGAP